MTLYGPLPARNFLRLLRKAGDIPPGREVVAEILDEMIEALGAERGFIFRPQARGGFRILLARNRDREPISDPDRRVSHHAIRRSQAGDAPVIVADARRDRRYHTEEGLRTGRQPISIVVLPLRLGGETGGGAYLDHRFQSIAASASLLEAIEHWRFLLDICLQSRERERLLLRARRRARGLAAAPAGGAPFRRGRTAPSFEGAVAEPATVEDCEGLVGSNPDMLDLFDQCRRLGRSDLPVVLFGETGTGKELAARAIHRSSPRAERPFLAVNCGGVPDALLETELFGHARGAFTGAEVSRPGLLVDADGGTVLLDEIGDMSPQMQQKLLRFLQDGVVRALGQRATQKVDVRILSSTQHDLDKLVEANRFRKDLLYRLRGTVLPIPPLRERREDILILAERFLDRLAKLEGVETPQLTAAGRRRLHDHSWPGNVRELENEMRRLVGLRLARVEEKDLSASVRGRGTLFASRDGSRELRIDRVVSEAERAAIAQALSRSAGNKSAASRLLGITRKALYRRMTLYGLLPGGRAGQKRG